MVKSSQEWVSAAVDGEIDKQAMAQLVDDVDSREEWQRYHMIGDAMRGELPSAIDLDLSASIAAAIENEPTIIAPSNMTAKADSEVLETISANNKPADSNKVVSLFKQFGQYAIAASVALVAIVGVQSVNQVEEAESPMPVFNTRPLVGNVSPVSLQTGPVIKQQQGMSNEQVIEQRRRVNAYIQDHMLQQRLNPSAEFENEENINRQ